MKSTPDNVMRWDLDKPHGLVDEGVRGFGEKGIMAFAVNRFAADLQEDGNRQRRYGVERLVQDLPLDAPQHGAQPEGVNQPFRRVVPSRAQQQVVGLRTGGIQVHDLGLVAKGALKGPQLLVAQFQTAGVAGGLIIVFGDRVLQFAVPVLGG